MSSSLSLFMMQSFGDCDLDCGLCGTDSLRETVDIELVLLVTTC